MTTQGHIAFREITSITVVSILKLTTRAVALAPSRDQDRTESGTDDDRRCAYCNLDCMAVVQQTAVRGIQDTMRGMFERCANFNSVRTKIPFEIGLRKHGA